MNVRNTFIDYPATPAGGRPQPLASAPAQYAWTMKDSLAAAAGGDEGQQVGKQKARPNPLEWVSESTVGPLETPATGARPYFMATPMATPLSTLHGQPVRYVVASGSTQMVATNSASGTRPAARR
eukprot:SRR837773.22059.p2 GENE.SRR837773.22059~~SRR837773.22059.p2  ORF type:complete len:141 (-),score=21.56 SRR837773.22059:42-416(-)